MKKVRKMRNTERRRILSFFAYISPWLIGFAAFTIIPMVLSLIYSFTNVKMATVNSQPLQSVGFQNYIRIFTEDDNFRRAILNTLVYSFIKVALLVVIAVLVALLLDRGIPGRKIFRVMIYLPAVIPVVGVALLWKLIFTGGEFNVVNYFLSYLGLAPVNFFGDGVSAMGTIIFIGIWSGLGPTMLIVLAAIQGIPKDYMEAAELDGANAIQRLFYIILPSISKTLVFVILTSLISSLQTYAEVKLLTEGGPGNSTMTMSMLIVSNAFKTLGNKTLGYACAQGWLVFAMTFIFGVAYVKLSSNNESKRDKKRKCRLFNAKHGKETV